ncbi:MAG: hypothetical protein ACRED5_13860 [Propylenella sp.]
MPDWLSLDRLIAIVGVLLGSLGIALAWHFYRRSIRDKSLAVDQHGPSQIAGIIKQTDAPIRIDYRNVEVEQVWRTHVLLWNQGYRAIEPVDFIAPIIATCGPGGRLLACGVTAVDVATSATVSFDFDNQRAALDLAMLRPGEAAELYFDTDTKAARPNLSIQMKSADSVGKPQLLVRLNPVALGAPFGFIFFFAEIALLKQFEGVGGEVTPLPTWLQFPVALIFLAVLVGVALVAGATVYLLADRWLRRSGSSVAYEFYRRKQGRAKSSA